MHGADAPIASMHHLLKARLHSRKNPAARLDDLSDAWRGRWSSPSKIHPSWKTGSRSIEWLEIRKKINEILKDAHHPNRTTYFNCQLELGW